MTEADIAGIETELDPYTYLKDVLTRLPTQKASAYILFCTARLPGTGSLTRWYARL